LLIEPRSPSVDVLAMHYPNQGGLAVDDQSVCPTQQGRPLSPLTKP
jgi:hypothetical protein